MKNKKNKRNTILVFNLLMLSSFAVVHKGTCDHFRDAKLSLSETIVPIHRPHYRCQSPVVLIICRAKIRPFIVSIKFSKSFCKFINIRVKMCIRFSWCRWCCSIWCEQSFREVVVAFRDSQCSSNAVSMARWIGLKASWSMHEFFHRLSK